MPQYDDDLQQCIDDGEGYDTQSDGGSQGSDGGKCGYGPWAEPEASEPSEVGPLESIQMPQYNEDLQQCTEDVQSYGLQSYDDSQGSGGGVCGYGPYADPQVGSEGPEQGGPEVQSNGPEVQSYDDSQGSGGATSGYGQWTEPQEGGPNAGGPAYHEPELGPDDPACHPDGPNFLEKAGDWLFNTAPGEGGGPVPADCVPPAAPEPAPPPLSWPWNEYGPGCLPLGGEPLPPLFQQGYEGPAIWPAPPTSGEHGEGGEHEEQLHIENPEYDPQLPPLPGGVNQHGIKFVPDGQTDFRPGGPPYNPFESEPVIP